MPQPEPTQPTPAEVAAKLTVPQRLLLFCAASNTDWQKVAGIHTPTVQLAIIRKLVEREEATSRLKLTEHGRAVLAELLSGSR